MRHGRMSTLQATLGRMISRNSQGLGVQLPVRRGFHAAFIVTSSDQAGPVRSEMRWMSDPPRESRNNYVPNVHVELVIDLSMNGTLCSGMTLRKTAEKRCAFHKLPTTSNSFSISFMIGLICNCYCPIRQRREIHPSLV